MENLSDCTGADASSGAAGKRAHLSNLRSLIAPAIRDDREVIIKWRDENGSLTRKRVQPVGWKNRMHLLTACKEIIALEKIEEVTQ